MKAVFIALSLLSLPAMAEDALSLDSRADLCLGNYDVNLCIGNRPGWRPGPGYPPPHHHPRPIQCVAENYRGYQFVGYGRFPHEAENNALAYCYNTGSRHCRIRWCR